MDVRGRAVEELVAARQRSLELLEPLNNDQLLRQHSPLMSPLVWDLAHIGNYEEQWVVRAAGGMAAIDPSLDDLYDAFRHPRPDRPALPLLGPDAARAYIAEVRSRALDVVDRLTFDDDDPLLAGGFVVGLAVQHEHQHDETMLATLQLMAGSGYRPVAPPPPSPAVAGPEEVFVAGGPFVMGTDDEPWAYDNERPAHVVDLAPFWINAAPVTNREYIEFIADGGYDRSALWTPVGWSWRQRAGLTAPEFWQRHGEGSWSRVRFGHIEEIPPAEPVQHVCWYEADAFARWAGARLPTEAEWEAASTDPRLHECRGHVWQWTASPYTPYPGYRPAPGAIGEYNGKFMVNQMVLRGGSSATPPGHARPTYRNFFHPDRRWQFTGLRLAQDP
jgi:gamma-glutamyl hercynylcysteine S-oxide synthase